MIRSPFSIVFIFLLIASTLCSAQKQSACPNSKGYSRVHLISGFNVQISLGEKGSPTDQCRGSIAKSGGSPQIFVRGWSLWIDDISGSDMSGSGVPDVVFDSYTGNQGCCFEYTIFSLDKTPALIRKIHNQVPVHFVKQPDGETIIRGGDGAFDLLLLPHAESVFPEVSLKLEGSELKDISSEFTSEYDTKIAKARAELTPDALNKFRSADFHQQLYVDQRETVKRILTVVLNYLYSGREEQAWQALHEMWPPADESRVRSLILERRKRGLLSQVGIP
jgi:hypothetical protein